MLTVSACGSLEPPQRDGENAQKTGKNGVKMGEIRPKAVWLFGIFDGYFRQALALKLSRAVEGDAEAESLKEQLQYRSPAAAGGGGAEAVAREGPI